MAKAVFTTSESSAYDDLPEERYHFPKTYLRAVQQTVGDFIIYYRPRRTKAQDPEDRQSYFAVARVTSIDEDREKPGHYFAFVDSYLDFDRPVPFRSGSIYPERGLRKQDGSTNKGAFGRSVRILGVDEFDAIFREGFSRDLEPWEYPVAGVGEPANTYPERPILSQVINRPFRDQAFRRHVRAAYANTCAVTGLRLINGGGRPEVEAAHIQAVAERGPDSVRNGIALTGTVHWLFDRGLIAISPDYRVLIAKRSVPDDVVRLIQPDRRIRLPKRPDLRPHPDYLRWHLDHTFKGVA